MRPGLVSSVVPRYNAVGEIEPLLHSLAVVPGAIHEIVFVDDGSTDETAKMLKVYCVDRAARYHVMSIPDAGPGGARNRGLSATTGGCVWFVDADDDIDFTPIVQSLDLIVDHAPDIVGFDFIEVGA